MADHTIKTTPPALPHTNTHRGTPHSVRQTKAPQPRQHPALLLSRAVTDSADPTGDSDSHHTFLSGDTATSMVEYSLEKPSRKQDKEGVIMSQRIQWEALSISPEVSNARLGVDIDTLEALESQICRLLNDEEMAGDSLPAVARTISSPDDTAQIFAWDHEGRSLLIYTPGGVVVEITNDQNWGGVGVHLSPMYTMAEVVAHLELGDYDTTKVLEALAAAMSTSIVKRP